MRRRARHVAGPVFGACLVVYFAFQVMQGDRGIIAWRQLEQEIGQVRAVQAETAAVRARLESRVALLRPDNLDPDMLDERARLMLGLVGANDVTIFVPPAAQDRLQIHTPSVR